MPSSPPDAPLLIGSPAHETYNPERKEFAKNPSPWTPLLPRLTLMLISNPCHSFNLTHRHVQDGLSRGGKQCQSQQ
jgi:hypothetical protein